MAELVWLRANGLAAHGIDAAKRGTLVVRICGGYQMRVATCAILTMRTTCKHLSISIPSIESRGCN